MRWIIREWLRRDALLMGTFLRTYRMPKIKATHTRGSSNVNKRRKAV